MKLLQKILLPYNHNFPLHADHIFCIILISQLRLIVVEALGHMSYILSQNKLEEQLPKLIPAILNLYRRQSDPFHVTQV